MHVKCVATVGTR